MDAKQIEVSKADDFIAAGLAYALSISKLQALVLMSIRDHVKTGRLAVLTPASKEASIDFASQSKKDISQKSKRSLFYQTAKSLMQNGFISRLDRRSYYVDGKILKMVPRSRQNASTVEMKITYADDKETSVTFNVTKRIAKQ